MLKHRLMSGFIIACTMVLAANYLPPVGAWLIIVTLSTLGQLEFYTMANKAEIPVFRFYGIICGAAMISATFFTIGPDLESASAAHLWENLVLLASMMLIFVRQFPQKNNNKPLSTIACTLFGIFYVPFLFNYLTRLAFGWNGAETMRVETTGRMLIFYLILVVKITDVGAYFTGRAIGKHKMFPRLSPKKTWEGFFGGVTTAILASLIFCHCADWQLGEISLRFIDALVLGILLSISGVIGDLFESLVKRGAGVKDSGVAVPGMGGVLDVLDSLLFGAPVLYVYARMLL